MKSSTSFRFSSLFFFFFIVASMAVYSERRTCRYKLFVQTGDDPDAGTNSRISVTLGNSVGQQLEIPDLKKWGTSISGYNYFQSGNRDLFVGTSACFEDDTEPVVCKITVTSDGSGQKPGWFLEEVEVTTYSGTTFFGRIDFYFSQWLAKDKLTASIDNCDSSDSSTSYSIS